MFDYINGKFSYKIFSSNAYYAVIEAFGVGYSLEIMERDYIVLPEIDGTDIKIYTVLLHREDKMSLCGFLKREDRDIFNVLTSVSGVGAKMALALLNSFKVSDLVGFVIDGDYKSLTQAKGVGPKLAQKIILELKDKLNSYSDVNPVVKSAEHGTKINNQNAEDARMVLLSLGYEKKEIENVLEKSAGILPKDSSAEVILKKSLQLLSM